MSGLPFRSRFKVRIGAGASGALFGWSVCAFVLGMVVEALGLGLALWWLGALELELELELVWGWEGNTACGLKDACG